MTAVALTDRLRLLPTAAILALRATPGTLAAALTPVLASAASCVCPTPNLPESPGTPILLVGAGLAGAAVLAWVRRRANLPAALVSVLAVVMLAGVLAGSVAAGASASTCTCANAAPGGVLAASTGASGTATGTPGTGAELPWIDALVLIGGGSLITLISFPRRRRRS